MKEQISVSAAAQRLTRSCIQSENVEHLRFASRFVKGDSGPFSRLGIFSIRDLLLHIPHHYGDYTHLTALAYADVGSEVTIMATVDRIKLKTPKPHLQIVELFVYDRTGVMQLTFFRQPWLVNQLHTGDVIAASGKVRFAYGFKQMTPTFYEQLDSRDSTKLMRIIPFYRLSDGIKMGWMRRMISVALADAGDICDFMPASFVAKRRLPSLAKALRDIHFPPSLEAASSARRRLAYDELMCLQLTLKTRRFLETEKTQAYTHKIDGQALKTLAEILPFSLSDEQKCAVQEILADMASPQVMNRLLLGDVGTGKTIVAAFALVAAFDTHTQAACMAPTSVLASQYAQKLGPLLDRLHISWASISSATPSAERARIVSDLKDGNCSLIFGTTALLSKDIEFLNLSVVVIDEQHRFGVDQRIALRNKGKAPDLLAMSATPIPRTLALSFYGDMSCSCIHKRPLAGAGVKTRILPTENLDIALESIRKEHKRGHQAYIVCPLIDAEDSGDELDVSAEYFHSHTTRPHSVLQTTEELRRLLPDMKIKSLTGRMPADKKEALMRDFRAARIDVLVSTTVIEVGVDVPNATVMLIFDADRFGLATLHQLRGRIGRGSDTGLAWLLCAAPKTSVARRRLSALEKTDDGFELAEIDLRLRHEGEILGYKQHGGPQLYIADLASDADLIEWAREDSQALMQQDPLLASDMHKPLAYEMRERFGSYFKEIVRDE